MAMIYTTQRKSRLEARDRDRAEYKMIFAMSFAFFIVLAALVRVVGLVKIPFIGSHRPRKSIVEEAREATNSVLPYAFMG